MYRIMLFLLLTISQNGFGQVKHASDDDRTIIMPIVFHVLYTNSVDSIEQGTILSELAAINLDYSAKNDTSFIEHEFRSLIGNPNIQFQILDSTFKNGSKGINYVKSEIPIGSKPQMISPLINARNCLNIYVYSMSGAATPTPGDYVRIDYKYIGSGTHTLTHEIGHAFGLYHLWGKTNCSFWKSLGAKFIFRGGDGIKDTPRQFSCTDMKGNHTECPVDNPKFDRRNYNNFMDYNACRCMFTKGQVLKMRKTIIQRHPITFKMSLK